MRMTPHPQRQGGISLIIVLWLLMLLGLMAAASISTSRAQMHMNLLTTQRAEARALAEAGIWRSLDELSRPMDNQQWDVDGRLNAFRLNGHVINVFIQDEAGRIDLNAAPAELLDGLLTAVGVTHDRRTVLVNAILEQRDLERQLHRSAAEDSSYSDTAYSQHIKSGPFNCVSDLRYVAGMDYSLYESIAPALTVYSSQPGIHTEVAPPLVLQALRELTATHPRFTHGNPGQTYMVISTATIANVRSAVAAVVAPHSGSDSPFTILAWIPNPDVPWLPQVSSDVRKDNIHG